MLPPKKIIATRHKKLLKAFDALSETNQASVEAFAEFLAQRNLDVDTSATESEVVPTEPLDIPRPAKESVVAAIRRLSETYPMLNKDDLLHQSSALMTAHIMQAKPASGVIDELQALFVKAYDQHNNTDAE